MTHMMPLQALPALTGDVKSLSTRSTVSLSSSLWELIKDLFNRIFGSPQEGKYIRLCDEKNSPSLFDNPLLSLKKLIPLNADELRDYGIIFKANTAQKSPTAMYAEILGQRWENNLPESSIPQNWNDPCFGNAFKTLTSEKTIYYVPEHVEEHFGRLYGEKEQLFVE